MFDRVAKSLAQEFQLGKGLVGTYARDKSICQNLTKRSGDA